MNASHTKIERMTGQRREARPQDRPRLESDVAGEAIEGRESWDSEKYFDPGRFNSKLTEAVEMSSTG
ncbi:MAG: hypothetical protein ACREXS_21145 [Gammaproteobacteria bacterium]